MTDTTIMRPGQLIEDLHCCGFPGGRTLSQEERQSIVEFAVTFEECSHTEGELQSMSDKDLVEAAYGIMAEYARGQI